MPTVLIVRGWRLFFYSNEGSEPIHIHARKGEAECKMWLLLDTYDVAEAWSHHLGPGLRRELRQIIFDHFDLIVDEWNRHLGGSSHAGH
jgi:hypothetical protein